MFNSRPPTKKSGLEEEIERVFGQMKPFSSEDGEYAKMVAQLETLYKLKEIDKLERVSRDTLAMIAGNLAGIVLIVGYERAHVMTSTAIRFLKMAR